MMNSRQLIWTLIILGSAVATGCSYTKSPARGIMVDTRASLDVSLKIDSLVDNTLSNRHFKTIDGLSTIKPGEKIFIGTEGSKYSKLVVLAKMTNDEYSLVIYDNEIAWSVQADSLKDDLVLALSPTAMGKLTVTQVYPGKHISIR
jgi:hypothetical protein